MTPLSPWLLRVHDLLVPWVPCVLAGAVVGYALSHQRWGTLVGFLLGVSCPAGLWRSHLGRPRGPRMVEDMPRGVAPGHCVEPCRLHLHSDKTVTLHALRSGLVMPLEEGDLLLLALPSPPITEEEYMRGMAP